MVFKNVSLRWRETRLNHCVKHRPISDEYANVTHAVGLLRACGERLSSDRTAARGDEFPSCEVDRHRTLGGVKRIARPNGHISDRLHRGPIKDCCFSAVRNVAYWHLADILISLSNVRFGSKADIAIKGQRQVPQ
jgi:hypothetical protein